MTPFELFRLFLEYRIQKLQEATQRLQDLYYQHLHTANIEVIFHQRVHRFHETYFDLRRELVLYQSFTIMYQIWDHECDQMYQQGKEQLERSSSVHRIHSTTA